MLEEQKPKGAETVGGLVLAALFAGFLCAMLLFIALIEADHKTLLTLVAYNNLAPGAEELKRMEIIAGSRGTVSHDVTRDIHRYIVVCILCHVMARMAGCVKAGPIPLRRKTAQSFSGVLLTFVTGILVYAGVDKAV